MSDHDMLERRTVLESAAAAGVLSLGVAGRAAGARGPGSDGSNEMDDIVPVPVEAKSTGRGYEITSSTKIHADGDAAGAIGEYLGGLLRPSTGYELPVVDAPARGRDGGISLLLSGAPSKAGPEGYRLKVNARGVTIRANEPAGLFAGVQTLRQLLPPSIESDTEQSGPWTLSGGQIVDHPRFDYRGAHLDVARHFFPVEDVKRFIDLIAQYKINHLHLHLTDDQGWRIEIDSWPNLTDEGADSEVGGGPGGYYTKEEYTELVEYAEERFVTVVPEIDMPGHTGAALESYAELNCDGEKREEDTGTNVGDTSLCIDKEVTYQFVDDVVREVAELTPGPYLHIGGDEAYIITDEEYDYFMDRAVSIVQDHGKRPLGWHQILGADPPTETIAQFWGTSSDAPEVEAAAEDGHELIASPATNAYLDMNYNDEDGMGQDWAGNTSVRESYEWDPGSYVDGVDESSIMGPETALWTEFIDSTDDIEYMVFPRLPAIAELGWSPDEKTDDWGEFRDRLAAQGPRWDVQDVNYYESSQVPWS